MRRIIVFASLLALVNSSLPMTGAAPPSSMVSAALAPAMGHSLPFRSLPIATHDSPDSATFDATTPCNTPLVSQSSRPPGPASLPIGDFGSTASTTSLKPTAVYSYTGSPVITPTIDGPFTGLFVDGDGTLSPGPGLQNPLSFVVEKQFDADDNVYWHDPTVGLTAFTTWNPATMSLWRDGNDDGIFQTGLDAVIAGVVPISGTHGLELNGLALFPSGSSPLGMSPFVYNDAEFIYDTPPKANNRYDDGEDIFYVGQYSMPAGPSPIVSVDSVSEFRGGENFLAFDPENPNGPPIAHIYLEQDPNYLYFHNDFLVDGDSPFYDFNGMVADDGFIDGDGTSSAGRGTPDRIGVDPASREWFTMTDHVDWYDADNNSHWTPSLDALWLDNDGDDVYSSIHDSLIVVASGVLTENLPASVRLNRATFEFVYSDEDGSHSWDSGEDIWGLSGDENWDYNYFDNRIAWLIDGDGAATPGRGVYDDAHVDGDQWFDAEDQVYWYDADDDEWTDGTDALWKDNNLNGTYESPTDTVIRADAVIPSSGSVLLQRYFVDGDGTTTNGSGSDDTSRTGQAPFQRSDLVYWYDADSSKDWTPGDSLWIDDGDGTYGTSITDTVIVSATGFTAGVSGTLLSPDAHWIGYDDGEVAYNGRYDSGEDITASNSYFAYDDIHGTPNFKYDLGERIYDRDYLEIWVYAEGDNTNTLVDGNDFAPDREPNLRDIGFRVHLNGIRIDDTPPVTSTRVISDYDAPGGIMAAAGWGPSRGFVGPVFSGPPDPAFGGFNRHYEYRIPRQGGAVGSALVKVGRDGITSPLKPFEQQIITILPDCSVRIEFIWKDIRRNAQGKNVGPSGIEYPKSSGSKVVWIKIDHPQPVPADAPPPPKKNDLNDPYLPEQTVIPLMPGTPAHVPIDSFFDVFYQNVIETEITELHLTSNSPLGDPPKLLGWQTNSPDTMVQSTFTGGFAQVQNLPPGGWIDAVAGVPVTDLSLEPGTQITNTADVTGTTGGGPIPPAPPGDDSLTFNPPITLTLIKTAVPITTVLPGGRITYTILYENPGPFWLNDVKITDTLPVSLTSLTGFPSGDFAVDSFFDITYRIDISPTMDPLQRGHIEIAATLSPTVQPGIWITNTAWASFGTPAGTAIARASYPLLVGEPPSPTLVPLTGVSIDGPSSVRINMPTIFTATLTPITATAPFTYVWQVKDAPLVTHTGSVPIEIVSLSLTSSGPQPITVTVSNAASTVSDTHMLNVEPYNLYLPLVLKGTTP